MLLYHRDGSRQLTAAEYKLVLNKRVAVGRNYADATFPIVWLGFDRYHVRLDCVVSPALWVGSHLLVLRSVLAL